MASQRKIAGYERRPIVVLRKRLTSKVLNAWYARSCWASVRPQCCALKHGLNCSVGSWVLHGLGML
eukprot:1159373-Pelagomonas_calceolata.AAC.5